MKHSRIAELAAIGADKAYRAAKHLSLQTFGVDKPMQIHRSQQGREAINEAEAINMLTSIYCEGAGMVHRVYSLSQVTTRFS